MLYPGLAFFYIPDDHVGHLSLQRFQVSASSVVGPCAGIRCFFESEEVWSK
jgi:hypothetical protein